jgi:hypothetical protein
LTVHYRHDLTLEQQARLLHALPILAFFESDHLSRRFSDIAWDQAIATTRWANSVALFDPEAAVGLRKLLEAKDCFVRAALGKN